MGKLTKCDKCPNWFYCIKDKGKCSGYSAPGASERVLNTPKIDIDGGETAVLETVDVG